MPKNISFDRTKMLEGFDIASRAVAGTIGPKGRNVYIDGQFTPEITNDGVTAANNVVLEDKEKDAGAYVVRNTTSQQNDDVGDGTTTVAVLLESIVHEALKRPENSMEVKNSLQEAGTKLLKILSKKSIKISKKDLDKVALISAENPQLAKMITEIINKLGEKAVINVEDSKTFGSEYEIVDGYEANVGFLSPYFANDKAGKAVYEDIPVFVTQKKISNIIDINPLFEQFQKNSISSCAIFCEDIDESMLGLFVQNKILGRFNAVVVRATGDGLKDIEGATGATMISDSTGIPFSKVEMKHLGRAKKLVCDSSKTLILGTGTKSKIRAAELDKLAENEENQYLKQLMKTRAAKLRGGVAVLRIGAPTDFEREYLKRKAEDAIKATQAALEEGVVEGGGMTLWRIAQELKPKTIGEEILKVSLQSPLRKIIENAGKDYTDIILHMPAGKGYDAKNDKYVEMMSSGIMDPAKVERCALENAVSAAAQFITTFCVITEIPTQKNG